MLGAVRGAPLQRSCPLHASVATRVRLHAAPKRGQQFVVYAKGKGRMRQNSPVQQQKPPTPPIDPDNEEFVVFVRAVKLPRWIPFTIVRGGASANLLVKAMEGNFGKEFYSKTLINQIGQAIYKEKAQVVTSIQNSLPGYSKFTEYEFGFKVRNKDKPDSWMDPEGIVMLPPENDIPKGMLDNMKSSFSALLGGGKK